MQYEIKLATVVTSTTGTIGRWKECKSRRCTLACVPLRRVAISRYARPNKSYLAFCEAIWPYIKLHLALRH